MNVSVIIATYGETKWADLGYERARPSALEQGAFSVVQRHEHDATLAAVRNAAAAEDVRGDWLCFLDADDELAPGYLYAMRVAWADYVGPGETVQTDSGPRPTRHAPLAAPALFVPAVQYVNPGGWESQPAVLNDGRPLCDINRAVIGTLVPRRLFLDVGGFPEEPIYEDWACWLACTRAGAQLVDVPDAVYRAHRRAGSRNVGPSGLARATYDRIRAQHLAASAA